MRKFITLYWSQCGCLLLLGKNGKDKAQDAWPFQVHFFGQHFIVGLTERELCGPDLVLKKMQNFILTHPEESRYLDGEMREQPKS